MTTEQEFEESIVTNFLTALKCKVCGQPMALVDDDGGFTGGWPEEDKRGNTIAIHWQRSWRGCGCGAFAVEGAVDNDPFSDDDGDYLEPDGELKWYSKDGEPLDDEPLPPELEL